MTMPHYVATSHAAGSKVRGKASSPDASSPESYAWIVNFNNGNANINHRDNKAFVRAVRSARASEYHNAKVSFRELFEAWQRARRKKVPSDNQLAFESQWIDRLLALENVINAGEWSPSPTTCFIARRPKARQIHAPDFSDRVVHHWLVPHLERVYESTFVFDSYANRIGKGTHAAVGRLQSFAREVHSGQGGGWYLQLDIRNFFNSIHRPTLYRMLRDRLRRERAPVVVQRVTHALLRRSVDEAGVIYRAAPEERALVPTHKRLENAPAGCGLPIGNLSSQFFANVYLDRLDQFIKRELKAKRYVRYVDDFVLVHRDRETLISWKRAIVNFLRDELRLELKEDAAPRPLSAGMDFLGYIIYPHRLMVRRRVVKHAFEALRTADGIDRKSRERRRCVLASYVGHFSHADARGLIEKFRKAAKN